MNKNCSALFSGRRGVFYAFMIFIVSGGLQLELHFLDLYGHSSPDLLSVPDPIVKISLFAMTFVLFTAQFGLSTAWTQ